MTDTILISTTGSGLARAYGSVSEGFEVETLLSGVDVCCLAVDPMNHERVYAGTQGMGVLCSDDRGRNWRSVGLAGYTVKAVAASPTQTSVVYAGTKPAALFISLDGGTSWDEVPTFRRIPGRWFWLSPAERPFIGYVQGIALSPTDADRIVVGIEAGATVMSANGGMSWSRHLRGALRDCHNLVFHPNDGHYVYEAGGSGGGAAFSRDGGRTWTQMGQGLDRHYGWAVAADPENPLVWYVSASPSAYKAHSGDKAQACIFRHDGSKWQRLAGGLPQPLDPMPYALITDPNLAGSLYAGLSDGVIWHSSDYGESWQQLPLRLPSIHRTLVML